MIFYPQFYFITSPTEDKLVMVTIKDVMHLENAATKACVFLSQVTEYNISYGWNRLRVDRCIILQITRMEHYKRAI